MNNTNLNNSSKAVKAPAFTIQMDEPELLSFTMKVWQSACLHNFDRPSSLRLDDGQQSQLLQ
ncbi:hypothetical protein [Paenibacillus sp. RC67]|uniref:hypothetical protein n=1 Tax=Paenibacillus sp. RC67 TaxID=3039392 RepID=UPI0024AE0D53|nr:hypothetical protein [Paenibacillus sp. RC67]